MGPSSPVVELKNLDKQSLLQKIKEGTSEETRQKAKEFSEKLNKENGVENAVNLIKQLYKQKHHFGVEVNWEPDESSSKCPACFGYFLFLK